MVNNVILSGDIEGEDISINIDTPVKGILNREKKIPVKWLTDNNSANKNSLWGYLGNNKIYSYQ